MQALVKPAHSSPDPSEGQESCAAVVTSHEPNDFDDLDPLNGESELTPSEPTDLGSFPDSAAMDGRERVLYREFCLRRLIDLLSRRAELAASSDPEWRLHHALIDHALYSAYRDCVTAGLKSQATRLLAGSTRKP
jgi:hypothetical protein